ncbi:MAG: MgtC/SapB family protein [Acidobacteria bacterium]|nr:MgtC/SapB family protein [Acidobacteriota bacterium]
MTPTIEQIGQDLLRMMIAYALALPIGWNREREARSAGLRTFPIVSLASCGLAVLGTSFSNPSADALSRIVQGLVTGIGFVGGGAILRAKHSVSGTATAASVWNVGILGAATGFGYYHIAVLLSVVNFLTLQYLTPLKREIQMEAEMERDRSPGRDSLLDD